jgi:hypothetical protein
VTEMKSGDGIRLRDSEALVLFTGLQTQSSENGNFSIVCRRRTRILVGDGSNVGLRGDLRHAKSRYFRGLSIEKKEILRKPKCLADHAGIELPHSQLEKAL